MSADIYLTDQHVSYMEAADRLEKLAIFDRVQVIPWRKMMQKYENTGKFSEMRRHLNRIGAYLSMEKIAKSSLIPDTEYKAMYASSRNLNGRLIWYYFVKEKRHMDFCYFDDGEGSYDNIDKIRRVSRSDAFFRTLLFGKESTRNDYPQYLYSPDFYRIVNPNDERIELRKIPNACADPKMKQIMNTVFPFPEDAVIKERVVFIDTMRNEIGLDNAVIDQILSRITKIFGTEEVVIKKHPRDLTPLNNEFHYYKYNGLPFETIFLNSEISSKLLVVVRSTAAITPKLLMDQEPHVIALYKILGNYTDKMDRLYQACKALYRHPEHFIIPENMSEFEEALQQYRNADLDEEDNE